MLLLLMATGGAADPQDARTAGSETTLTGLLIVAVVALACLLMMHIRLRRAVRARPDDHQEWFRDSESFMREAQELAHIGHWSRWFDGRPPVWSNAVFVIHGCDPAKPAPAALDDYLAFVHPDDRQRVRLNYSLVEQDARKITYTYRIRDTQGGWKTIAVIAQGERDAHGTVVRIHGALQDITDIAATEARLRSSELAARTTELLLRSAIDAMPFMFWAQDRDGLITLQNRKSLDRFGPRIGQSARVVASTGDSSGQWLTDTSTAYTGQTVDQIRETQIDGHRLAHRTIIAPIHAPTGMTGVLTLVMDITTEYLAQRQKREAEDRFVAAFRAATDAIVISRLGDGLLVDVNKGFETMSGWTRSEAVGQTAEGLGLFGAGHNRTPCLFHGAMENLEQQFITRDGQAISCLVSTQVFTIGDEPHLLAICRNNTERKQANEDRRQAMQFQQAIYNTTNAMLIDIDRSGMVVRINRGIELNLGYAASDLVGHSWSRLVPPALREDVAGAIATSFESGTSVVREFPVIAKDGRRPWVAWTTSVRRDHTDAVETVIGIGIDRTSQKQAMESAMRSERDAVIGRMAGRVAHEVNNPLEAIKALIDPLRRRSREQPSVIEGLDVIERQVDRIARLVRALLGLVRQQASHRTAVRPAEILTTVVDLFSPRFSQVGKRLELVIPERLPESCIDADQVQQVVINLLENALSATGPGGFARIIASTGPGWLEIIIEDDGPGVGDDPERLFQPFFTTKPNGSGLGLAVARTICEAHAGWIRAENLQPHGARFHLHLRTDLPANQAMPASNAIQDGEVLV